MAGLKFPSFRHRRSANADTAAQVAVNTMEDVSESNPNVEKNVDASKSQDIEQNIGADGTNISMVNDDKEDIPTPDAQRGVQQVEAVTLVWTKKSLIFIFIKYVLTKRAFCIHQTNVTTSLACFCFTSSMLCKVLFSPV